MPTPSPSGSENRLLALLPRADYKRLSDHLQVVPLPPKQILYRARSPIDYVYFPTNGFVSAMTVMGDGRAIEVATIGNEGMVGLTAFIGAESSSYEVMVQVPGEAMRLSAAAMKAECGGDNSLRRLLILYNSAFSTQVSYAVACNGLHKVEKRCCRWLLMTQDRVGSDVLPLTHEFLSIMLGVRRSSLTEVLKPLQERGLIQNGRGEIRVLNRKRLEAAACECYGSVKQEFNRLLGFS